MKILLKNAVVVAVSAIFLSGCINVKNNEQIYQGKIDDSNIIYFLQELSDENNKHLYKLLISNGYDIENINWLTHDEDKQYFWQYEDNICVLYEADIYKENIKKLADFLPNEEYGSKLEKYITDFGICEDWLIASVGYHEGSGSYFNGEFVMLKKDGSEQKKIWLTDDDKFFVVDDWIYYNSYTHKYGKDGCYRIRPNEMDKEYLGDNIDEIIINGNDWYLYGEKDTDEKMGEFNFVKDLVRYQTDSGEVITIFKGNNLPKFDNEEYVRYYDFEIIDDYIVFTAAVYSYSEGDVWYGSIEYNAKYKISKDGQEIYFLSEKYAEKK